MGYFDDIVGEGQAPKSAPSAPSSPAPSRSGGYFDDILKGDSTPAAKSENVSSQAEASSGDYEKFEKNYYLPQSLQSEEPEKPGEGGYGFNRLAGVVPRVGDYPEVAAQRNRQARKQMADAWEWTKQGHYIKGPLEMGLGAMSYFNAPISAATDVLYGQPTARVTGSPKLGQVASMAGQFTPIGGALKWGGLLKDIPPEIPFRESMPGEAAKAVAQHYPEEGGAARWPTSRVEGDRIEARQPAIYPGEKEAMRPPTPANIEEGVGPEKFNLGEYQPPEDTRRFPVEQGMIDNVADQLEAVTKSRDVDLIEAQTEINKLPEEFFEPELQKRLQRYGEGDPEYQNIPGPEKELWNKYIAPLKDIERKEFAKQTDLGTQMGLDLRMPDEQYMHRITIQEETPQVSQDFLGGNRQAMTVEPSGTKDRVYFAAEETGGRRAGGNIVQPERGLPARAEASQPALTGNRAIISLGERGPMSWRNKEEAPINWSGPVPEKLEVGDTFRAGGKEYVVRQAYGRELEEHVPQQYQESAYVNTLRNVLSLKTANRNVEALERIKTSPEFKLHASTAGRTPPEWVETAMPNFRGWKMEPRIAHVLDDFAGAGRLVSTDAIAKANHGLISALFWSPLVHIWNVAGHNFVSRGMENFTPGGIRDAAGSLMEATREVATMGPKYREFLREGASMFYGGVQNREFYDKLLTKFGQQIERDPTFWEGVAKQMRFTGAPQLAHYISVGVKAELKASQKMLWGVGDVLMMQRYLELERAGMPRLEAIRAAESHIPNYRVPDQVLGSRFLSRFLQDPTFGQFNRYHYGWAKSWANVIGEATSITAKKPADVLKGNAELFATMFMTGVLMGPINSAIKTVSGNEDASMRATGPMTAVDAAASILEGRDEYTKLLRSLIMFSPAVNLADEFWTNRDVFGRNVFQAETPQQFVAQGAEAAVSGAFPPYSAIHQGYVGANERGLVGGIGVPLLEQSTGLKLPAEKQVRRREKWVKHKHATARSRARHPQGPIESLIMGNGLGIGEE